MKEDGTQKISCFDGFNAVGKQFYRYMGEHISGTNERHGRGKCVWADEIYEGFWKYNKRHGSGRLIIINRDDHGEIYEGIWKNDNFITGVKTVINGKSKIIIQGKFDLKDGGYGKITYQNKDVY